jgi:hypothetical protein
VSAPFDPVSDVTAPVGAVAWTASRGWLTDTADVTSAMEAGDQSWLVDPDGVVRDVADGASIALVMLVDKRITSLRRTAEEADRDIARRAAEIGARVSEHADRVNAIRHDVDDVRGKVGAAAEDLAQALSEQPLRNDR